MSDGGIPGDVVRSCMVAITRSAYEANEINTPSDRRISHTDTDWFKICCGFEVGSAAVFFVDQAYGVGVGSSLVCMFVGQHIRRLLTIGSR
jgi:hypothetical protein